MRIYPPSIVCKGASLWTCVLVVVSRGNNGWYVFKQKSESCILIKQISNNWIERKYPRSICLCLKSQRDIPLKTYFTFSYIQYVIRHVIVIHFSFYEKN